MAFVCHLDWYPLNLKQLRQREKKWRSSFSPFQQILQAKKCPRKDACRYFGVLTQGPMAYKHGIPWVKWLLKLIPQPLLYKLAFASKDDTSKPPYLPISSKVFCLWYVRPVLPAWSQKQRLWVRTPSAGIEPVSSRKHCHRLTDGDLSRYRYMALLRWLSEVRFYLTNGHDGGWNPITKGISWGL